jgi:ABC-2 type transport system ATP-binding protein
MTGANAIELSSVQRHIGRFTLGPLDFTVPRGGVLALVGNNGAGKTTLLDLLMGFGWADAGTIRVLGLELPREATAIKSRAAYVNPDMDFSAWGTVGKALDFISGFYRDWDDKRCNDVLRDFRLDRSSNLGTHSFGERMKFLLVTALARDADLFLLDEPTIGLDVHAQEVLSDQIGILRQRDSRTIVISTHQLGYLEQLADHVAVLHHGRVLAMDRIDVLLDRYRWIDVLCSAGTLLPQITGLTLHSQSGDRARFTLDRSVSERGDAEKHGLTVIDETTMSLQDLVSALTRED